MSSATNTIKKPSKWKYTVIFLIMAALYTVSWNAVDADLGELWDGLPNIGNMIAQLFPPKWSYFAEIMDPMFETIKMAILGTTIGAVFAIPLILTASNNLFKSKWLIYGSRTVLNFVRTLPDLLLASLFVSVLGIGPLAGVFSLAFLAFGMISKMGYESVETIDPGPLEAMTAVGANKWQFISFAVVPQALPSYVAYVLYTFEVCIRASAVLGYVGAGGIGMVLKTKLDNFQYQEVETIILFTLVIVILIDTISSMIRERLL